MLKKILLIPFNFFKALVRFSFILIINLICAVIYFLSGERDKEGQITVRKARRIRRFTNVKIFIGRHCLWLADFLGIKASITDLNNRLEYGVQLCDN